MDCRVKPGNDQLFRHCGLQNDPTGKSVGPAIQGRSAKAKRHTSPCAVAKWAVSSLDPAGLKYGLPRGIQQIRCFALCLKPHKGRQERSQRRTEKPDERRALQIL